MVIKRYIFLNESADLVKEDVIREINWKEFEAIKGILNKSDGKDLSFADEFGEDKRIAIPFKTTAGSDIGKLVKFFQENGYEIDFEAATVSKSVEIPAGPKKGQKTKKSLRIGKLLKKIFELSVKYNKKQDEIGAIWSDYRYNKGETEEDTAKMRAGYEKKYAAAVKDGVRLWKEVEKLAPTLTPDQYAPHEKESNWAWSRPSHGWPKGKEPLNPWYFHFVVTSDIGDFVEFWNKKSEYYRKNPKEAFDDKPRHTIIITRSPIDVLRMSDFQNITSCHSPQSRGGGGSYYQCAVAEAQGHGLVAYVVENSEIPEDFDIQQDEIFADAKRGVPGINPISRVRLRKFVHDDVGELAVPEEKVYGEQIPGFVSAVVKWAREQKTFKNLGEDDWPEDIEEWVRYGGSYEDNKDGYVLNQLIGSDKYRDNDLATHEETEEDSEESLANQLNEIQEAADAALKHFSVHHEIEDMGDGELYTLFYGGADVTVKGDVIEDNLPTDWRDLYSLTSDLESHLSDNDIYGIENIEIEDNTTSISVRIDVRTSDYDANPAGFEAFVSEIENSLDSEYENIKSLCRQYFVENEYMMPSEHEKLASKISDLESEGDRLFQEFETEVDGDEINFTNKKPIYISVHGLDQDGNITPALKRVFLFTEDKFLELLQAEISKSPQSTQIELPGLERDEEEEVGDVNFDLRKAAVDIDITARIPPRYKEYSIAEIAINFMTEAGYEDKDVLTSFHYVKWMDENLDRVAKLLQQAFNETALSMGLHPELRSIRIDISSAFEKEKAKSADYRKYPDLEASKWRGAIEDSMIVEIKYFDLGDYIFVNEVISHKYDDAPPGSITGVAAGLNITRDSSGGNLADQSQVLTTTWVKSLFVVLRDSFSNSARNLLVPVDVFKNRGFNKVISNAFDETAKEKAPGSSFYDNIGLLLKDYPLLKGKTNPQLRGKVLSTKFTSIRESILLNSGMLFESDQQISGFLDRLVKNKKSRDLVMVMKPLDVAQVVAVHLDLQPKPACTAALNLIKQAHDVHQEGLSGGSFETNKQYPVPPIKKRGVPKLINFEKEVDEAALARPGGKTVWGGPRPPDIKRHHFPPDPRAEPGGWPYDDMTVAGMDPKNKSHKRGLTTSKDNSDGRSWKQKGNPLNPDMMSRKPGGDGAGGGGAFQLTRVGRGGDTPGGGSSWTSKGTKGWNSMPGAEYANPDKGNKQPKDKKAVEAMGGGSRNVNPKSANAGDEDEETPSFMKDPPVGSSIPTTNFGGRTPVQPGGRRNWMKK